MDYVNATGGIANYYPDFFVKTSPKSVYVIETKVLEDLDDPLKVKRLRQRCEDVNAFQTEVEFDFVYVDQETFDSLVGKEKLSFGRVTDFASLVAHFTKGVLVTSHLLFGVGYSSPSLGSLDEDAFNLVKVEHQSPRSSKAWDSPGLSFSLDPRRWQP